MRPELFWNMRLLVERLAVESRNRRRLKKIKGTIAGKLGVGYPGTLISYFLTGKR